MKTQDSHKEGLRRAIDNLTKRIHRVEREIQEQMRIRSKLLRRLKWSSSRLRVPGARRSSGTRK
jgi:hypothetical protein